MPWNPLPNDNVKKMSNSGTPCRMQSPLSSPTLVLFFSKTYNKLKSLCLELLLHLRLFFNLNLLNPHHNQSFTLNTTTTFILTPTFSTSTTPPAQI